MKPIRAPLTAIYKDRLKERKDGEGMHSTSKQPETAIDGAKLKRGKAPTREEKGGGNKEMKSRPIPREVLEEQKRRERTHREIKSEALELWKLLENPVFDSPLNHESNFSDAAVQLAKRGKRCTVESGIVGSTNTKKAIRSYERSAKRHGNEMVEVERLQEYPNAVQDYSRILRKLKARMKR